jgi:predicted transcriptional regulator
MPRRKTTARPARLRVRSGPTLPALVASSLGSPVLTRLPPREQEIATIVYLNTEVSAKELEAALSHQIGNSAIRCMLGRLVRKGVLKRRKAYGKTFVYSPAVMLPEVQERALERLAEEYFGGSLHQAMQRLIGLVQKREAPTLHAFPAPGTVAAPPAQAARAAG